MATQRPGQLDARASAADLTGKEYYIVALNSSSQFALAGAGARAVGVLQEGKAAGKYSTAMLSGISKVICGGTVAANGRIAADAAGKAVAATTGDYVVGIAMTGGAANAVIEMLIQVGDDPIA